MIRAEQADSVAPRRRRWLVLMMMGVLVASCVALTSAASAEPLGGSSWGYNAAGQLGNGTTVNSRVPVAVQALTGVIAISAGGEHSLALLGNGTVMSWGGNREGQLGNGTTTSSHVPVAVPGLAGVTAISAGRGFSLALLSNGTVMAWGSNETGQLGSGSKAAKSTVPVAVKGLAAVSAISAGEEHALARMSDGTVMSWGSNSEGQLGNGKMANSTVPVAVKGLTGVTAVSAGAEHSLALLANGTVMSWGGNGADQLGVAPELKKIGNPEPEEEPEYEEIEIENSDVPVPVQALTGATAISAGAEHSLALLGNGTVMSWGANGLDQLGNGSSGGISALPTAVGGLSGVTAISASDTRHNLALLGSGAVAAWGYNPDGQLGDGLNVNSPVPVLLSGIGQAGGVAAGGSHSLAFGQPAPSVSGVSPSVGPASGGTSVTISGASLTGATAVRFGSSTASFSVNSSSSITAVAPAGTGSVDVTVTTPVATSAAGAADKFSYVPPPNITKMSPATGPAAGGTSVTITGTNFTGATAVSFGASAATYTVNSATSITAASPAGTTGTTDVTIATPSGPSAITTHDHFKYEAPTITAVTPNMGPAAGGTTVTISGSGFALGSGTVFKFGTAVADSVNCTSSMTCVMVTAAAKARTVDVKAKVGTPSSKANPPADQFTYQ